MAISELTKTVVAQQKNNIRQTLAALNKDIDEHQVAIDALRARKLALKADLDSLDADIPNPTPVEM